MPTSTSPEWYICIHCGDRIPQRSHDCWVVAKMTDQENLPNPPVTETVAIERPRPGSDAIYFE